MWSAIFFFGVALTLWGCAHYYIGRRIMGSVRDKERAIRWLWILLGAHFVLVPVGMFMRRFIEVEPFYTIIQWAAYLGMGAFTLLLVLMVIKDLLWLVYLLGARVAVARRSRGEEELGDAGRRLFMTNAMNATVITAAAAGTKYGLYEARKLPDVVDVEIPVAGLAPDLDGFHIVQLSDIHVGPTIRRATVEAIVERVNELGADIIVITGDLVDGHVQELWEEVEPITHLRARHGLFFCTGNHEYYWDAPAWCRTLEEGGIRVLNNAHHLVVHGRGRLLVAGCTDYSAGRHILEEASDPVKAMAGAPDHDFSLLLAHHPKSIFKAGEAGFDLQLSGHTHGGQFWPWNHVVGLVHPFSAGLERHEKTWIYVSRGTGYWGPPMRIGAPSEITSIRLKVS
ncbi:MAG: metallophosphoesterase [Bradymonadaceae bacterium]